jgi:hypothetical protein
MGSEGANAGNRIEALRLRMGYFTTVLLSYCYGSILPSLPLLPKILIWGFLVAG